MGDFKLNMKEKVSIIAIIVNAVLAAGKILVGVAAGSALIFAEGLHSLSDVFASAIGYAGIRISQKPSDKEHPYGHYKFEVLSGLVITIIIFVAGLGAIYEAYKGFIHPESLRFSVAAFVVMIAASIVNEVMARVKVNYGKKENSISLISDGMHSRVDVYSSLGVVAGLIVARYWIYADSLFAFLIGIYIIKESVKLGKEAVDSLLDVSAGEEIEQKIESVIQDEKIELSSLKTQKKGAIVTANLEIILPSNLDVKQASKVSEKLRDELIAKIENLRYVVIQIKSLELETNYYKPSLGHGFGWQRRGKFKGKIKDAAGAGPGGDCVCPKCGYRITHEPGIPCSSLKCPDCNVGLERK